MKRRNFIGALLAIIPAGLLPKATEAVSLVSGYCPGGSGNTLLFARVTAVAWSSWGDDPLQRSSSIMVCDEEGNNKVALPLISIASSSNFPKDVHRVCRKPEVGELVLTVTSENQLYYLC
jgi:hypothetical protein